MLTEINWRPKIVAALYITLQKLYQFEERIGKLLLRSDVCYAGQHYCYALAELNSPSSVQYLQEYLTYYLTRTDLHYDQVDALAALSYLDEINGTSRAAAFLPSWRAYWLGSAYRPPGGVLDDKSEEVLADSLARFRKVMALVRFIRTT